MSVVIQPSSGVHKLYLIPWKKQIFWCIVFLIVLVLLGILFRGDVPVLLRFTVSMLSGMVQFI